jgi:hypothetical protein
VLLVLALLNQLISYCWGFLTGNLVLLMHLSYDIGELGKTVSMPTRSMWINGMGVYLQHKGVLQLRVPGSLSFCGPKLEDTTIVLVVITN